MDTEVRVKKGEIIDRALRRLKKKLDKEGTLKELRSRPKSSAARPSSAVIDRHCVCSGKRPSDPSFGRFFISGLQISPEHDMVKANTGWRI